MQKIHLIINEGVVHPDNPILRFIQQTYHTVRAVEGGEAILVLGGDGTMLEAIRRHYQYNLPFYGLNFGHLGFLMNEPSEEAVRRIFNNEVQLISIPMLEADTYGPGKKLIGKSLAFNDFNFERTSRLTARIRVTVNGKVRFDPLLCDGILVATPAGSTAYNAAADGKIVPLDSNQMVLTGICPAVFHRWRSSHLPHNASVLLEVLDEVFRPVRFLSDGIIIPSVHQASIRYSDQNVVLGFCTDSAFGEKVLDLQFNAFQIGI